MNDKNVKRVQKSEEVSHFIVNGAKIAKRILEETLNFVQLKNITPKFAIILVGNKRSLQIYVKKKLEAAKKCGVESKLLKLKANISQKELEDVIKSLNNDPQIGSMIVQLPLPKHINTNEIIKIMSPRKDLDGFHPKNLKDKNVIPLIGEAVLEILNETNFQIEGKRVVLITKESPLTQGLSKIFYDKRVVVNKLVYPKLKLNEIKSKAQKADLIITALGKAKYLNEKYVKKGAAIIDIGIARKDKKLCGDVDFEKVVEKVSFITPVPGGVGPVTVACAIRKAVSLHIANCK